MAEGFALFGGILICYIRLLFLCLLILDAFVMIARLDYRLRVVIKLMDIECSSIERTKLY